MRLLTKAFAPLAILFASMTVNAADLTTSGDGSVMLSVWQLGNTPSGDAASVLIDTGINFSDLAAISGGGEITVDIESIFDVSAFLSSNVLFATSNPFMNIVAGATNGGTNQLFSSNDSFVDSAINVELNNSINNTNLFLAEVTGSETSLSTGSFPNAASTDDWGDNFGTAFQDIDNAFELVDSVAVPNLGSNLAYDGTATGEMILFETSSQGTLNGQPLQINDFGGLYTFAFDLASGELTFASAVPLPAAVWFMGSALLGLMGFSRRRSVAA